MIEQRPRRVSKLRRFIEIFDPTLAFSMLFSTLYFQVKIMMHPTDNQEIILVSICFINSFFLYISIISVLLNLQKCNEKPTLH